MVALVPLIFGFLSGVLTGVYYSLFLGSFAKDYAGVGIIVVSLFGFVLAYGLWKKQRWGWLFTFAASVVLLFSIFTLNIVNFAIGLIVSYYMRSKGTMSYFNMYRGQSAMEYLASYGWVILVVGVVIAALFSLGLFNTQPRAPPGSCYVYRPNGPGTLQFTELQGTCIGELPQTVASLNTSREAYIAGNVTRKVLNTASGSYSTVSFWIYWGGGYQPSGISKIAFWENDYMMIDSGCNPLPTHEWSFVTIEWANGAWGNSGSLYVNGVNVTGTYGCVISSDKPSSPDGAFQFSGLPLEYAKKGSYYVDGGMSNLQIYNSSLGANQITSLYHEGIGGAPIDIRNLALWAPLNGNLNDYSGNNNRISSGSANGGGSGIIFSPNWFKSYSAP